MSHWWSWWTKKSCSWCHHWLDIYFNSLALFWNPVICHGGPCAFLLTLNSFNPSVLRHCWLGGRKGIRPIKNWAVGCWHCYCLERGADLHMVQLIPLHPKTPLSLASDWFYLSGTVLPRLSWKRGRQTDVVHCVSEKKQDTKLLPITSPNINRFSKFF